MHRYIFPLMLLAASAATPAVAQFGFIFGDPPPRPQQDIPGGRRQPPPQQRQESPPSNLLPPGPPPSQRNIQSQPLPPPPGGRAAPQTPTQPPSGTAQPAQRQPQRGPQPQQPVEAAAPPPSDETIVEPPAHKVPNPTSVFAGLDKITGRITAFDIALGETVQFGALQVTPRACYTRPPTETPHTTAFIEVDEVTLQGEIRRIYTGWMFAASPGLHAVEHPIYDIWLTDCKGGQVAAEAQPEPEPEPARARSTTRQQQQQQRQQQQQQRQQQQPRRQQLQQRDF